MDPFAPASAAPQMPTPYLGPLAWVTPVQVVLLLVGVYFLPELSVLARAARVPKDVEAMRRAPHDPLYRSPVFRFLLPLIERVAARRPRPLRLLLNQAGWRAMDPEVFRARQLGTAAVGLFVLGAFAFVLALDAPSALALMGAGTGLGYQLPFAQLQRRVQDRKRRVFLALPMFYQRIAAEMMAGTGFREALAAVVEKAVRADRSEGPVYEQMQQALILVEYGTPFREAVLLAARDTGVQSLVDTFLVLLHAAEEASGKGSAKILLDASRSAAEQIRLVLEANKGRLVIKGTGLATAFEMPALLVAALVPAAIGGLLGAGILPFPWF